MNKFILIFSFVFCFTWLNAIDIDLSFSGGIALPTGSYGSVAQYDVTSGYAKAGYFFSSELDLEFENWDKFLWSSSITFINNPYDKTVKEKYYGDWLNIYSEGETYSYKVTFDDWNNFPILTGVKFKKEFFENISICGFVQAGVNICRRPDMKIKYHNYEWENDHFYENKTTVWENMSVESNLAMRFGFGVNLFKHYNIGFNVYNLGVPAVSAEYGYKQNYFIDEQHTSTREFSESRSYHQVPIRIIALSVGVNL